MSNPGDITYVCELDRLDGGEAQFAAGTSGAYLTLPREAWHEMGRPGRVFITPTVIEPSGRNR